MRETRTEAEILAMISEGLSADPTCANIQVELTRAGENGANWSVFFVHDEPVHPCRDRAVEIATILQGKYDLNA